MTMKALCLVALLGCWLPLGGVRAAEVPERAPIRVTVLDDTHFGRVVADRHRSGSVSQSADGFAVSTQGGVEAVGGSSRSATRLRLRGEPGADFLVSMPAQVPMHGPGGGVVLREFQVKPDPEGTFDGAGNAAVTITATVTLSPGVSAGEYRVPVDVLVDYR